MAGVVGGIPEAELKEFFDLACTIGGYVMFPSKQIDRKPTVNAIRGMNPYIKNRFDLTLECIRRLYKEEESPLYKHLVRYRSFFNLFEGFEGYYRFFLLDDLVDESSGKIKFWLHFTDFGETAALPADVGEYREYMENASNFVKSRNARIEKYEDSLALK